MPAAALTTLALLTTLAAAPLSAQPAAPSASSIASAQPAQPAPPAQPAQPASSETMPSVASLFRDLPRDFANLFAPESALILGTGGAVSLAIHPADRRLTQDATSNHVIEESLDPGQYIGDGYTQAGGALATYLLGRLTQNPRIANLGSELTRAQAVTAVLTQGLKYSVQRTRPNGGNYSFPSGHTSATFASAAVLQREFGWKVGAPAYAIASAVAISRLSENAHYASDLAFGAAIGLMAGRRIAFHITRPIAVHATTHAAMPHDAGELTLTPLAVPRGAGLHLVWTTAPE